ncbi:hypothetical protein NKG94_07225 [Micromonospora sp. M12]
MRSHRPPGEQVLGEGAVQGAELRPRRAQPLLALLGKVGIGLYGQRRLASRLRLQVMPSSPTRRCGSRTMRSAVPSINQTRPCPDRSNTDFGRGVLSGC